MENVLIRECTYHDIDAVLQLDVQWEQENIARAFIPIGRKGFIAHLEEFKPYFLVAESDRYIVGYANGSVHLAKEILVIPEQEPYLEIDNIYVRPDFRKRHIGGTLLQRLLEVAEHHGIQRFLVSSDSKEMEKILTFYRRYGFTTWHVQMFKEIARQVVVADRE
jgi:ribosomal protein S18 acetylase RimI-like enzyme